MIGALVDRPVEARLHGSLAAATLALRSGARVIRTHDVAPARDAIRVVCGVLGLD
jgi:dihydropteroate synthase